MVRNKKIHDCILNLKGTTFKVRAVIADNHSVNVKGFSHLLNSYDGAKKLYIIQPITDHLTLTYFWYIHLIKNIRNISLVVKNLFFDKFQDTIDVPEDFISWKMFYEIQEFRNYLLSVILKISFTLQID